MRFLNQTLIKFLFFILLIVSSKIYSNMTYDESLNWKKLLKKEILIKSVKKSDDPITGVKAWVVVKAPLDFIWQTMINSNKEKEIYTSDYNLKILDHGNDFEKVEYEVIIFFNKFKYILHRIFWENLYKITWTKERGDFKMMKGYWEIQETPETGKYLIIYESYVDTGFFIPGFLIELIQKEELKKMIRTLRDWLEKNVPVESP